MQISRAIVIPFGRLLNEFSSTFSICPLNPHVFHSFGAFSTVLSCLSQLTGGMQKPTAFRHFLQLLEDVRLFPSFASYVVSRGSLSAQTIHTRLTFPKTDAASNTYSNPSSTSLPETPKFVRVPLAILPASLPSCSADWDPGGIGDLRRMILLSTSHIGKWNRFRNGIGFGIFCVIRSAPPMIARSTVTRCATSSAADHSSAFGFVFHCSGETESAARNNAVWAQLNFSRMGSRGRMPVLYQELPIFCFPGNWKIRCAAITSSWHKRFRASRRQPVQTHAPAAAPGLPQTPARRSAAPQAACLLGGRMAQRSPAAPPAIP